MPRCVNGHDSQTDDYCDFCGAPIATPGASAGSRAAAGSVPPAPTAARCGSCGAQMLDGARFCENCGWDAEAAALGGTTLAAAPPAPAPTGAAPPAPGPPGATWQVVAVADRGYYDTIQAMEGADAGEVVFPVYWPERRFPLAGNKLLIGRGGRSDGTDPDVNLGGQFADPGVSHLHAALVAQPDGGWVVVDLGSSNGTYLNDSPEPIKPQVPVPFRVGDKVHLGAWTTLTLAPI